MIKLPRHTLSVAHILLILLILNRIAGFSQVSISPGTWITVKEGGSMMIGTDLHIKSVADSSGYFVDQTIDGDVTITGDITVDRYLEPDIWHNVASPVSNENSNVFSGTDLVFWYDETQIWNDWNFGWVWYTGATGGPLMVFRGYDVFYDSNPVTVSYSATGAETLNTGPYTYNVTITDPAPNPIEIPSHLGWNFAGNPYPSPVDWLAAGWDKSDINDAKYIWDGTNDVYTIYIGGSSPAGINGGTRFIPSNQGFWVQAIQNGTIGIANSVRLGDMTGTPDFYKESPLDYPLVSLVASGNNRKDEVVIRFIEGTTGGMDINFDASKLFSFVEEVPQLSINTGTQLLALNTLPQLTGNLAVTLGFRCGTDGIYQIDLSDRTQLDDSVSIYLKDLLYGHSVNLTSLKTYRFTHHRVDSGNRFRLFFNPSAGLIENNFEVSNFSVFSNRNEISVIKNINQDESGEIIIYNMLGQKMLTKTLMNDRITNISTELPTGYYLLYIITNQYSYKEKVLIIN